MIPVDARTEMRKKLQRLCTGQRGPQRDVGRDVRQVSMRRGRVSRVVPEDLGPAGRGRSSPSSNLIVVDLPAPFGPKNRRPPPAQR